MAEALLGRVSWWGPNRSGGPLLLNDATPVQAGDLAVTSDERIRRLLRRLLLLIILIAAGAGITHAQSPISGYCEDGNQVVQTQGLNSTTKVQRSYPACTVSVFDSGTSNLSVLFQIPLGPRKPTRSPRLAQGRYTFWLNTNNTVDVQLSGAGITTPFVSKTVKIGDASTGIGGTGTANRVAKFSAATTLANSTITDNGISVGINNASPNAAAILDLTTTTQASPPPSSHHDTARRYRLAA